MPDDGNATLLQEGATMGRFIFVPDSFLIRSRFVPGSFLLAEGACPELAEGACPELVEGASPELEPAAKEPVLSLSKGLP